MRSDLQKLIINALLLSSLFLTACGGGVTTSSAPVFTSLGVDFYLTLPDHRCVSDPAFCSNTPVSNKLIVAAATATTGEVTFNGVITPFSVAAGNVTLVTLDPAVVLTANETVEAKGIHVTALAPVSVHVVSENITSAEGYLALPTFALGTNYYVMSFASARYAGSEFAVVATQNSTTVTINPTAAGTPDAAGVTKPAGTPFTVLLNTGETYQYTNPANADMTGTLVTSDKPIAVFSGHRCAEVPASGVGYCDYLVEQLPDVSVWGKTYHTMPFSGRDRYTVRVMASQNGTTFTTAPAGLIAGTLNAGQFADVVLTGTGEFVSNNPVLVAQFMHGYADDLAAKGDPSMVLVTPTAVSATEKGVTDSTFGVYGLAGTVRAYMNVVTESAALANLKLDNVAVDPTLFNPIGSNSIYSAGTIPVSPGLHTLLGSVPYSALVYDFGISWNAVSYAYPVGATLTLPTPVVVPPAPAPVQVPVPVPVPTPAPTPAPGPAPEVCAEDHEADGTESHANSDHHGQAKDENHVVQNIVDHVDDNECHDK
jgi:hypothetical protein